MEQFAIPGAGAIIEKAEDNVIYILIQERFKEDSPEEKGLIEIPAGKIRAFENIYDCLRREIKEETNLDVIEITGENEAQICECNGYKTINYTPFSSTQNLQGIYPIMVQVFICTVRGDFWTESDEAKNFRWITLKELDSMLNKDENIFYPMHIATLKKYLKTQHKLSVVNYK